MAAPSSSPRPGARPCILCGKCLEACPLLAATHREELSPRAKAHLFERLRADQARGAGELRAPDAAELAGLCLGCGRCAEACPQGVDVPGMVAALRAGHPGTRQWLFQRWMDNAPKWTWAARTARMTQKGAGRFGRFGLFLKGLAALDQERPLPALARAEAYGGDHRGRAAALFPGCVGTHAAPQWTAAATGHLQGLGMDVRPAEFGCCGAPLATAGLNDESFARARENVAAWRGAGCPLVVVFCHSCRAGLAAYADPGGPLAKVFRDEAERLAFAGAVTPLAALLKTTRFVLVEDAPGGRAARAVGHHRPCHADNADVDGALLRAVFGPGLDAPQGGCCGFGGVMQLAAPELSAAVAERTWAGFSPDTALALTGCSACAVQLKARAPEGKIAGHWLEALAPAGSVQDDE